MSDRLSRVKKLAEAVQKYADDEKKRIENEVKVLEAILEKRTGGNGIQAVSLRVVSAAAENDLKAYLEDA
jgi:hypothetical protein